MVRNLATAAFAVAGNAARGVDGAAFIAPSAPRHASTASATVLSMEKGAGGMFDTRNPDAMEHEDPRKSISAAPSFEEYLKMRESGEGGEAEAPAAAAAAATPDPVASSSPAPASSSGAGGSASAEAATSTLRSSQSTTLDKILAAIPDLAPKPDLSWDEGAGQTVDGSAAVLDGRDAPGPSNVAWISALTVDSKVSGLTIFNGPLNDVPHLLSRATVVGDNLIYELDFRPRAYGAYELRDEEGNYPGPAELGRKAFEYSGARNDFFGKFCDEEVQAFFESTKASFEGSSAPSEDEVPITEFDKLTQGPLAMTVRMSLTDSNVAAIASAQEKAADYWLSWATDASHEHRPGAPVNTQYVYDAKFRQNAYSALLPRFVATFGSEDGAKLAAADSGPLDEAYVGGGS